jgi:hypothetical protein
MNARTEGRIAHRPGEHEVRGQVRRASVQTMADIKTVYEGIHDVLRTHYDKFFARDKRLDDIAIKRLPLAMEAVFKSCGVALDPIELRFKERKSSVSRCWMQPHLLDGDEPLPILHQGVQTGVQLGAGLYAFVFYADRRRIVCVDREPAFLTIQRHAFTRYAVRRRLQPDHVLASMAADLFPLTGMAMAQLMANSRLQKQGHWLRMVLPLSDGLALGDFNDITPHPDCADEPYGVMMIADRAGKRHVPLGRHPLTYLPNPDRHIGALIRTIIPDDMMRDEQERFWRAMLNFQARHRENLEHLFAAVWLHNVIGASDNGDMAHPLHPHRYDGMVEELAALLASEDGLAAAKDRRELPEAAATRPKTHPI